MRNVSTNATILFGNVNWSVGNPGSYTFAPGSLMFEVTSPSGKNISPVDGYGNRWFGSARELQPEEAVEFNVDSSHVCEFNEIGTYKIVAKSW
jgi:hypothetical protein